MTDLSLGQGRGKDLRSNLTEDVGGSHRVKKVCDWFGVVTKNQTNEMRNGAKDIFKSKARKEMLNSEQSLRCLFRWDLN